MIETEDVVLLRRLVEHGRKHGALLNADNEAWGAIERLREENARVRVAMETTSAAVMEAAKGGGVACQTRVYAALAPIRAALNQQ